jgi:hypothetical protein
MPKEYYIVSETPTQTNIKFKEFNLDFQSTTKNNFYRAEFNQLTKEEQTKRDYLHNILKPKYYDVLIRSNLF